MRMNWISSFVSSYNSDFNYDFNVSFIPEQNASDDAYYDTVTRRLAAVGEDMPKGRNENGPHHTLADWVRPHNMYDEGGIVEDNGRYHEPICACHPRPKTPD
jgi:predicted dithiol-disulfide oxidoreductase (DUF899 family)